MAADSFDFKPSDPFAALTSHYTEYLLTNSRCKSKRLETLATNMAFVTMNWMTLSRRAFAAEPTRTEAIRQRANNLLDGAVDLPADDRDQMLIAESRALAVVDPEVGNPASDDLLYRLAARLMADEQRDSAAKLISSIMGEQLRDSAEFWLLRDDNNR